jgi:uncharacterized protein (DUF302 family)
MTQLITKPSPHSVDVTLDRLEAAIKGAGAVVFARVDHAKGAASVDQVLRPTQMLMFGNPMLGTPLMQAAQTAGLDLPLRVVCYQDASGDVHLSYHAPTKIAVTHNVPSDAEIITKMTGALDNLTNKAIAAD